MSLQRCLNRLLPCAMSSEVNNMHSACIFKGGRYFEAKANSLRTCFKGQTYQSIHAEQSSVFDLLRIRKQCILRG